MTLSGDSDSPAAVREAVTGLDDTLAAARAALETLAASRLGFAAQLRVHKASTAAAHAWFRDNVGALERSALGVGELGALIQMGSAPEETDEILRHTLGDGGVPLDVGSEEMPTISPDLGDDDVLADLDLSAAIEDDDEDEALEDDSLVQFTGTDAEEEDLVEIDDMQDDDEHAAVIEIEDEDEDVLEVSEVDGDDDDVSYVVFDEDDEVEEVEADMVIGLDDDGELEVEDDESDSDEESDEDDRGEETIAFGDEDDLESESDPDSAGEDALVSFTEADDLMTLGGEDDEDDFGLESVMPEDDDTTGPEDDETPVSDATLVTDLASLVKLQDMIAEDETPGAAHSGEGTPMHPEPRVADPVRVTTTLTDDDLDRLGFTSADELVAPEGADADPHSETGSRPAIRLGTPESDPPREKEPSGAEYTPPRGASVDLGASLPTIRDQQPGQSRPSAAAIRIDPSGGGRAIQEEDEALALGGAPDDEEEDEVYEGDGGFSLDVEEYEVVEDEESEERPDLPGPKPKTPSAPAPMPTLTADQETRLLRQAQSAYDRGELQVAAEIYSDILDFNPDQGRAALGRGRVYLDLGDYARAMSDFTVAEDIIPEDPDVHAAIGELYYARKDYQRAIDYFDEALERNDRHAMAWCRRGIAHYYRKDYDQAYKDLVKAQKLDDSIPNIRTYIGMVKKKRK